MSAYSIVLSEAQCDEIAKLLHGHIELFPSEEELAYQDNFEYWLAHLSDDPEDDLEEFIIVFHGRCENRESILYFPLWSCDDEGDKGELENIKNILNAYEGYDEESDLPRLEKEQDMKNGEDDNL